MIPQQFVSTITDRASTVADAISTGAAWEIWFQIQLLIWFRQASIYGGRELQYPANARLHIDLVLQDKNDFYGIELKVQNASNSRLDLQMGVLADIEKLKQYGIPGLKPNRWAVGVAYTQEGRGDLIALGKAVVSGGLTAYYNEVDPIGVLVVAIPPS